MVGTDITVIPDDDSRPSTQDVNQTVSALAPPMVPMTQQAPAPLPSNFLPIPTSLPLGRTSLPTPPSNPLDVETPKDVGEIDTKTAEAKQQRALTSLDVNNLGRPQQQIRLPQQGSYPMTPESTARHALSAFSNPLMWLAIAGGALTRNHALGAMTAATGVLEGARANDIELQKLHAQKFKGSVAGAKLEAQRQIAAYEPILNDPNMSSADKIAELTGHAAALQDNIMLNCLRAGNLGHCQEMVGGLKKMVGGLDKATESLGDVNTPGSKAYRAETDRMRAETARGKAESKAGGGAIDPTQPDPIYEMQAKSYAEGNWRSRIGIPAGDRARFDARANEIGKTLPGGLSQRTKQFMAESRAAQTAGNIEGSIESALKRAEASAPVVVNLSELVDRSRFPDLNSILLPAKEKLGDSNVVNFRIGMETLIRNYAQAISGSRSGVINVEASQHAHELIQTAFNQKQTFGAVAQMLFEIRREEKAAKQTIPAIVGQQVEPLQLDQTDQALQWIARNPGDSRAREMFRRLYGQ